MHVKKEEIPQSNKDLYSLLDDSEYFIWILTMFREPLGDIAMEKIVEAIALNIVNIFKARDVPTGTEVIADDSVKHSFVEFFWHFELFND